MGAQSNLLVCEMFLLYLDFNTALLKAPFIFFSPTSFWTGNLFVLPAKKGSCLRDMLFRALFLWPYITYSPSVLTLSVTVQCFLSCFCDITMQEVSCNLGLFCFSVNSELWPYQHPGSQSRSLNKAVL